jgi:hypothetical protein
VQIRGLRNDHAMSTAKEAFNGVRTESDHSTAARGRLADGGLKDEAHSMVSLKLVCVPVHGFWGAAASRQKLHTTPA